MMLMIIYFNMIIILISLIILILNFFISKTSFKSRNMLSPFECGFDPLSSLRLPFSSQFFLISVIFLIFDVEISLIFPLIKTFIMMFKFKQLFIYMMIILLIGVYYELNEGSLNWIK